MPALRLFLCELLITLTRFRRKPDPRVAAGHDGRGRGVMVIPGFMANDRFTLSLRNTLAAAGYRSFGWGEGLNTGPTADLFDRLDRQLDRIEAETGGPVSLVGWSLGGIYARELAKRHPARIDRVVTLGSPFSGSPRANRVWRLYEAVTGHSVDDPPIKVARHEKPPVPTTAIWSPLDGIVAASAARGLPGERDRAVQVSARHMGMVWQRCALRATLDALEC